MFFMRWLLLVLGCLVMVMGVSAQEDPTTDNPSPPLSTTFNFTTPAHRQDGNRVVAGSGTFPNVESHDVPLGSIPMWAIGAPVGEQDAVWIAVDAGGILYGIYRFDAAYSITDPLPTTLPAGMPPVMASDGIGSYIDFQFPVNLAPLTHATRAPERVAYITDSGSLSLLDADNRPLVVFDAAAAPDSRVVLNDLGLAAVYIGATDSRYVHDVLGDALESTSLIIFDMGFGQVIGRVTLPDDQVFEGISPFWADVNGDGQFDIVTTVSDATNGSRIRVYQADGTPLAEGPAIGRGGRWRHQIAWAAFGVDGEYLLAEVLTPHEGGIVGFFRFDASTNRLERVARVDGYTSHIPNSRNVDMAVAGDFDGDGQVELVLPTQDLSQIAGLALTADNEIVERWSLPLDGTLMTNLSAVTLADGRLALAAGIRKADGSYILRIWIPE
jgi:hypothetical protein